VRDVAQELLDELLACLDLETIDLDIFRGRNERERGPRLFGGQVAAQALVAAGRTVEGQLPHSLHAYFLRPGDPTTPVIYRVDRIRDGRSFSTRHVVAIQRGKAIFNVSVSFQVEEVSYEHQLAMPEAPAPESLLTWSEHAAKVIDRLPPEVRVWAPRPRPIDMRFVDPPTFLGGDARSRPSLVWLRVPRPLPDDPFLHQCLLTYASDLSLLDNIVKPHGRGGPLGPLMMASLDHAVWFHKAFRVDDWLLYVQDSPAASGGRGFARGTLFTRAGELVASVAQEGLMRPVKSAEDRSQ
jgi:acyl-CoA thioesterase-2